MSKFMTLRVEDDFFQREMLAETLRNDGFEVIECATADAAEARNWPSLPEASFPTSILFLCQVTRHRRYPRTLALSVNLFRQMISCKLCENLNSESAKQSQVSATYLTEVTPTFISERYQRGIVKRSSQLRT